MKTNILNFKLPLEQAELLGIEIYNAAFVVKNIGSCIPFLTLWALKTSRTVWTLWTMDLLDLVNLVLKFAKVRNTGWTAHTQWQSYLTFTRPHSFSDSVAWLFWLSELWDRSTFGLVFNRFLKQVCLAVYVGYQSHLFTHTVPQFWGGWEKKATALSNFANLIWYRFFWWAMYVFCKSIGIIGIPTVMVKEVIDFNISLHPNKRLNQI